MARNSGNRANLAAMISRNKGVSLIVLVQIICTVLIVISLRDLRRDMPSDYGDDIQTLLSKEDDLSDKVQSSSNDLSRKIEDVDSTCTYRH